TLLETVGRRYQHRQYDWNNDQTIVKDPANHGMRFIVHIVELPDDCQRRAYNTDSYDRELKPVESPLLEVCIEIVVREVFPGFHQHFVHSEFSYDQPFDALDRVAQ